MKRATFRIWLTVLCLLVLSSCAAPANEGVLIVPSGNGTAAVESLVTDLPETELQTEEITEKITEEIAEETMSEPMKAEEDVLLQACRLFEDPQFESLFAQYRENSQTDPVIAAIAAMLAYEQQVDDIQASVSSSEDAAEVFWTDGGSVWHITAECSALAKSKSILSGSESQAMQAGKTRVCKRCGG